MIYWNKNGHRTTSFFYSLLDILCKSSSTYVQQLRHHTIALVLLISKSFCSSPLWLVQRCGDRSGRGVLDVEDTQKCRSLMVSTVAPAVWVRALIRCNKAQVLIVHVVGTDLRLKMIFDISACCTVTVLQWGTQYSKLVLVNPKRVIKWTTDCCFTFLHVS